MNPRKIILAGVLLLMTAGFGRAAEPGWDWRVVMFGENREKVQNTPIVLREYRPLHFYGNTVRRIYYRGTPLPIPKALTNAGGR